MSQKNNYLPTSPLIAGLMGLAVAGRLLPHFANVTPIGGLTVWGGSRLKPWQAITAVVGAMLITDAFIGFHRAMPQVYGTLILTTISAHWLKPKSVIQIAGFTLVSSLLFFVTTNWIFYPWQMNTLYPNNWGGQVASYVAALPFLRNSLIGDMTYTALFFSLEWASSRIKVGYKQKLGGLV